MHEHEHNCTNVYAQTQTEGQTDKHRISMVSDWLMRQASCCLCLFAIYFAHFSFVTHFTLSWRVNCCLERIFALHWTVGVVFVLRLSSLPLFLSLSFSLFQSWRILQSPNRWLLPESWQKLLHSGERGTIPSQMDGTWKSTRSRLRQTKRCGRNLYFESQQH